MSEERFRAYTDRDLGAVIDRMARQAAALLDATPVTLVGVLRRGAPLADRVLARLREHAPRAEIARLDLEVKRYADDLALLRRQAATDAGTSSGSGGTTSGGSSGTTTTVAPSTTTTTRPEDSVTTTSSAGA